MKNKFYAVAITNDIWASMISPFDEAVFEVPNATEARKRGRAYIRAWQLIGETILRIRIMSEAEYKERTENRDAYMKGGYKKYIA